MQMMSKVKVKPKTSEVPLKSGRGSERGAHSAVPPPEASSREFDIKVDLTGKSGLGLDVDWADGKTLFIKSVKADGAIVDHNATCSRSDLVQGGDRVVSINDRSGDAKAMLAEVRAKGQLHLVIRTSRELPARPAKAAADAFDEVEAEAPGGTRHHEFTVTLDMAGKSGLGLDVDWSDGKTLYIKSVKADGAVSEWNRSCPLDDLVQGGDRVTAINGKTGDPKAMLAECRKKPHLELAVQGQRQHLSGRTQAPHALQDRRAVAPPAEAGVDTAAVQPLGRPQQRAPKPHEFVVWADMTKHAALGLDVDWADGKTLYINSVQPGAIQEWNQEHPLHQQVSAGDRIIAVNGYADDPEAMANLCKELVTTHCRFQLLVRGPPPPPSSSAGLPPDPQGEEERRGRTEKEKKERKGKKGRDDSSSGDAKEGKPRRGRRSRERSDSEDSDGERRERREREEKRARKKRDGS